MRPPARPILPWLALAVGLAAIGHLAWEAAQLPLYTLWSTGTPRAIGPVTASPPPPAPAHEMPAQGGGSSAHSAKMQMAHAGRNDAHGTGTVNSVDPAQHKLNISHQPIPEIGWPAMTMEFPVAPSVDLTAIKPGTRVNFTIEQQPGGMYQIEAISPAGGGDDRAFPPPIPAGHSDPRRVFGYPVAAAPRAGRAPRAGP